MFKKKMRSLESQRTRWGWVFLAPWIVGIAIFFLWPMIQTVIYSLSRFKNDGDFGYTFIGLENYMSFFKDANKLQMLSESIVTVLPSTLLIVTFSTMIALLLRQEFPLRGLARAVFFLPVIIASGPIIDILNQVMSGGAASNIASESSYLFQAPDLTLVFADLGVPQQVLESITSIINEIFDLMWQSGVQILLLLAALNSIPTSFYEVAMMEGATGWEKFWKITLPTASPTLVVVVIYTLIDRFTAADTPIIKSINAALDQPNFAGGATEGVIYCVCVLAVVGLASWILSRVAFYSAE